MLLSIASFSFHGALGAKTLDLYTYLEACRYRYHLHTADIWSGLIPGNPADLTDADLRKIRGEIESRDLILVNYHADGCHPWDPNPEVRKKHLALAEHHLRIGEALGARTIRIDPGGNERHWSPEAFDLIADTYRNWSKRAADAGYRVGPETHWGATNYPDNMLAMAKAVANPAYGILLHLGKDAAGTPDDYDIALAPIAMHTHLDQKNTYTRLATVLNILREANYTGALGIEHHSGAHEFEEVDAQIALTRRALAHARSGIASKGYGGNPLLNPKDERAHQARG